MPTITKQTTRAPIPTSKPKPSGNGVLDRLASGWSTTDYLKMLLYGSSGTGKTTLWATFPGPILVLLCSGGNKPGELKSVDTPEYRKKIRPVVIPSIADMKEVLREASGYATVVLDHASGFQDLTLREILGLEELPAQKSWGMATQQQYGASSLMCKDVFRTMLNLDCNVVIVAQERTFGEEGASEIISPTIGAALTPSVTGWLGPACDYVVQTFKRPRMERMVNKIGGKEVVTYKRGKGVEYCLRTEDHDVYQNKFRRPDGKTRAMPECIVDPSYDKILKLIKG